MASAKHRGYWTGFTSHIRRYVDDQFSVYILANRTNIDFNPIMTEAVDNYK
jgi:hypothetical protein